MATAAVTVEVVELQDGTSVTLRPLNIKNRRAFQKAMAKFFSLAQSDKYKDNEGELDIEQFEIDAEDLLIEAAVICINNRNEHNEFIKDRDKIEDALDIPTIYRILKVCGGVDLSPENLEKDPKTNRV